MTSMDTPTIALQDDRSGETGGAGTPSVVLGNPRVIAVTRVYDPFADDHLVTAATRLVNAADVTCAVLADRVDMRVSIATGLVVAA